MPVCVYERAKQKRYKRAKPRRGIPLRRRERRKGEPPVVSHFQNKYAPPGPGVAHSLTKVPPPLNLETTATSWKHPDIEGGGVTNHFTTLRQ